MFFRYGFAASFTLVFVSEIGDKTFFMAGICAMRVGKLKAFMGAALALAVRQPGLRSSFPAPALDLAGAPPAEMFLGTLPPHCFPLPHDDGLSSAVWQVMTAISVIIGVIFKQVPDVFTTSLPVAEYIAIALLIYFGLRSIRVRRRPSIPRPRPWCPFCARTPPAESHPSVAPHRTPGSCQTRTPARSMRRPTRLSRRSVVSSLRTRSPPQDRRQWLALLRQFIILPRESSVAHTPSQPAWPPVRRLRRRAVWRRAAHGRRC